jgi:hypothetical protein
MKTRIFLTGLALIAFVGITSAQQKQVNQNVQKQLQPAFVDADNDGVCDNFNAETQGKKRGQNKQANQTGKKQACKSGDVTVKGNGNQKGNGQGQGQRLNFIDANNNGICDNKE